MAGCKGAKKILAINADPEAPIIASADYAVIGDLHEIVPAISAELRKARKGHGRPRQRSRSRRLLAVGGGLFARRALFLTGSSGWGKPVERFDDLPRRVRNEAVIVLGQRKLLQRLVPGLMHAFIFWGFLVLFPTIVIAMIGAVDRHATLPWLGRQGWFALLVDLFALLVLAGVVAAFAIRKVQRPSALRRQPPRRGRPDPGADRRDRDDAAPLARLADRARAERVAGGLVAGLERALAAFRRAARWRRCASASSSGRTC